MGGKYLNSPIVEVVCELRLPNNSKWDITIPGLIYEKLKKDFPKKKEITIHELSLAKNEKGLIHEIHPRKRVQFFTEKKNIFIQVGENRVSINCLKPYPSWERFKPLIEKAFKSLTKVVKIKKLQRIGLRYINRIEIPEDSINLEEYFNFRPFLGENLPQEMSTFIVGTVLTFDDKKDQCRIQLTNSAPEKPKNVCFSLDLDYFIERQIKISKNEVLGWIDKAHERIEEIFEGCITERLRDLFQEEK